MGINFPNAPAVGELHPTPPQAGVPQYRWDGVAWVAQSQDQLAFVKRTGDTMSGALTLPADPAAALQAATKQYVDAKSSLYISDNPPVGPPDGSMWWDSDNGLLYIRYNDGAGPSQWVQAVATPAIDSSVFVSKAGDTMGGLLKLSGNPVAALDAAPKQFVETVGGSSNFAAGMSNGVIVISAAAGALTVAVKTVAGADPSAADPVYFYFHNNAGGFVRVAATAPTSVVMGSTKLGGFTSGTAGRLWITAHNNAGTVVLGVIKCSDPNGFVCPQEWSMAATYAPGNQSRSFFTTVAIPGGASWRFIGFCDWDNLVTAGTWTAPDRTYLFLPGMPKPGDVVQKQQIVSSTPTAINGTQWTTTALALSIGLTSKCNLLELFASGTISIAGLTYGMTTIFKYATSSPIGNMAVSYAAAAGTVGVNTNYALDFPNSNAAASYTVAVANNNGVATVQYPATGNAVFVVQEIMG
jgi:hypothetical protein